MKVILEGVQMGEAKRRKEKDPTWGKTKKAYLTDTYNLFRIVRGASRASS